MRSLVLSATLAAALLPSSARAQSVSLTESEAIARLSMDSPRVRAIQAGIEVARADALTASRWPNPRVIVDRESAGQTTEYLTTFGQVLPISGQRGLQMHAAASVVEATAARADDQIRRARADLRLAFADLLSAQLREDALMAARDRLQVVADLLVRREAAGDAAGFDRLRAEREVVDIEADLALAASDRARAQAALTAFFADAPAPSRVVARVDPGPAPPLPAVEDLIRRAESTRSDLLAFQKDIEASQWSMRAADRRPVPEPELIVGTKSSSGPSGGIGRVFSVQAAIPLFDHGQIERALAVARGQQAEARRAVLRQTLRTDITGWHDSVEQRRAAAERYRAAVVSSADQIERIAQVSYDAGERGILELLDAYRVAATTRIRQAMLDAAVRQSEIELEFVSGWEIVR